MTVVGVMLVLLPFTKPKESFYEFIAVVIILSGIPVYFVAVRGWYRPPVLTRINGQYTAMYMHMYLSGLKPGQAIWVTFGWVSPDPGLIQILC